MPSRVCFFRTQRPVNELTLGVHLQIVVEFGQLSHTFCNTRFFARSLACNLNRRKILPLCLCLVGRLPLCHVLSKIQRIQGELPRF
jgi:hypothetical protein